jgi:hypothetical protein
MKFTILVMHPDYVGGEWPFDQSLHHVEAESPEEAIRKVQARLAADLAFVEGHAEADDFAVLLVLEGWHAHVGPDPLGLWDGIDPSEVYGVE